jgi:hypothetical protein
MNRNRLYLLLSSATAAGYAYLASSLHHEGPGNPTPCLIKNVTGIPCPSCGSTRSVASMVNGDIAQAVMINPMGILVAGIMLTVPFWLLYDIMLKKDTLYINYIQAERKLQAKWVAIALAALVIANWIWNINKGL